MPQTDWNHYARTTCTRKRDKKYKVRHGKPQPTVHSGFDDKKLVNIEGGGKRQEHEVLGVTAGHYVSKGEGGCLLGKVHRRPIKHRVVSKRGKGARKVWERGHNFFVGWAPNGKRLTAKRSGRGEGLIVPQSYPRIFQRGVVF